MSKFFDSSCEQFFIHIWIFTMWLLLNITIVNIYVRTDLINKKKTFFLISFNIKVKFLSMILQPLIKIIEWNRSGKTGWQLNEQFSLLLNHVFLCLRYITRLLNQLTLFSFFTPKFPRHWQQSYNGTLPSLN